jgi:hypothetical protein
MLAGAAPVDIMPAMNAVGNPLVVLPVPMYPKFGRAVIAPVDEAKAPRPTFVTAAIDPEVPMKLPAESPALPSSATAPVPALLKTAADPEAVRNDPAESPPDSITPITVGAAVPTVIAEEFMLTAEIRLFAPSAAVINTATVPTLFCGTILKVAPSALLDAEEARLIVNAVRPEFPLDITSG